MKTSQKEAGHIVHGPRMSGRRRHGLSGILLAAVAGMLGASAAFAGGGAPIGSLDSISVGSAGQMRVASDAAGNHVVAWWDQMAEGNTTDDTTHVQRYLADGTPTGASFTLPGTRAPSSPVALAMNASGQFAVVWVQPYDGVYLQRYQADGTPTGGVSDAIRDSGYSFTPGYYNGGDFDVGMDAQGDVTVSWSWAPQTGAWFPYLYFDNSCNFIRYSAVGQVLGTAKVGSYVDTRVTTGGQGNTDAGTYCKVAVNDAGASVVSWVKAPGVNPRTRTLFARRYSSSGQATGLQIDVAHVGKDSSLAGVVARMDGAGDFALAWSSASGSNHPSLYLRRYNSSGLAQGKAATLVDGSNALVQSGQFSMDPAGDLVVVWRAFDLAGNDISGVQRFDSSGAKVGPVIALDTGDPDSHMYDDMTIASDASGNFVVGWGYAVFITSPNDTETLYTQRYSGP